KTGDSLASVVEYYSVKIDDVIKNNPDLADLDLVPPGSKIFLPDAKIPIPPPVWMRPLWGVFTSGYGMRPHPMFAGQWQMHAGLDLAAYYANVAASRNGQVSFAGYLGSYGNAIVIEHEAGFKTLYAHLSKVYVKAGQFVTAGSIIGVSGNTGFSTGPHLHFEIIKNGVAVNPQAFLR
ncbi:MAG: peptidoglycan DD-metalloendopeptidase family protein, partial [Spirochaetia bacterium]|nr:peptidoglycan DD-metalloendopeptidase family protein [Spirochaetia bacterium]